ncbi:MAG: aconitase X catalytic domain-containing protein [Candidatus Hadarchaeales archaeon]
MYLSRDEERMLEGEEGEVVERMFRLLVRLGDLYGADRMIPVSSCQVSGVSYKSVGDPGLEFLEDLAGKGARVRVRTTLNPAGLDREEWRELGFPEDFAEKQLRILEAFGRLGAELTVTCTPYLAGLVPSRGEHLAWSESSAVAFSNSVLGARTNREGGPSALAAAICGLTPRYGLHLEENREPTLLVEVEGELEGPSDFGALGYWVGKEVGGGIPYFRGIKKAGPDELKALGAAMAASGAVALFHVEGITPEADPEKARGLERVKAGREEVRRSYEFLTTGEEPELVVLGCPHASAEEVSRAVSLLEKGKNRKPVWICTSRKVKEEATRSGLRRRAEEAGGRLVADTCAVVSPLERLGLKTVGVDSAKAAHYLPGLCGVKVVFSPPEKLLGGKG